MHLLLLELRLRLLVYPLGLQLLHQLALRPLLGFALRLLLKLHHLLLPVLYWPLLERLLRLLAYLLGLLLYLQLALYQLL